MRYSVLLEPIQESDFEGFYYAHIPMLDRDLTALILAAVTALVITYMWSARFLPRWRARRLASTWSVTERKRFVRF